MSYTGPRKISYLFVDGGYWRKTLERYSATFFGGVALPIEYSVFSRLYTKVFYYDCVAPRRKDEQDVDYLVRTESQREFFARLRMLDGWHVTEGVISGVGADARQKQVDIQIAVDMLTHSHRRNMHELGFLQVIRTPNPLLILSFARACTSI